MMGCFQLSERKGLLKKNSKLKVVPKKICPNRALPVQPSANPKQAFPVQSTANNRLNIPETVNR